MHDTECLRVSILPAHAQIHASRFMQLRTTVFTLSVNVCVHASARKNVSACTCMCLLPGRGSRIRFSLSLLYCPLLRSRKTGVGACMHAQITCACRPKLELLSCLNASLHGYMNFVRIGLKAMVDLLCLSVPVACLCLFHAYKDSAVVFTV